MSITFSYIINNDIRVIRSLLTRFELLGIKELVTGDFLPSYWCWETLSASFAQAKGYWLMHKLATSVFLIFSQ